MCVSVRVRRPHLKESAVAGAFRRALHGVDRSDGHDLGQVDESLAVRVLRRIVVPQLSRENTKRLNK